MCRSFGLCAARSRDAGLKVSFDTRFLRYLSLVTVGVEPETKGLSPTSRPCVRIAIQFFKEKMRHDVLSEMSMVLKARYLITERVLFHPTKCAAGSLLGTAAQLLGLEKTPNWMQVQGDQEFLLQLSNLAETLLRISTHRGSAEDRRKAIEGLRVVDPDGFELAGEAMRGIVGESLEAFAMKSSADWRIVAERAKAGYVALWRLASRRFPKLAFRWSGRSSIGGEGSG